MKQLDSTPLGHHKVMQKLCSAATLAVCLTALWLSGCSTPPPPPSPPVPLKVPETVSKPVEPPQTQGPTSNARTPHEYRVDAAKHLYKLNGERIFKGRLPPMLYAIGVLDVEVDKQGQVTRTQWVRAPGHAPEVMKEIEKTVRQAAPYPVPAHMNKVVYSDVWLWHKSGKFQLDTLTEGQD
jgi:hypothetical protein